MPFEAERHAVPSGRLCCFSGICRLARFLYAFDDKINETAFKEKLGSISVKDLAKTAKERRAGSLGYAEAMLIFYNKRLKNPLPWEGLYTNKIGKKKKPLIPDESDTQNQNS